MEETKVIPPYLVRLRLFRKSIKKTQTDFAKELGTTKSQYSKMENGIVGIYFEQIMTLSQIFGVNPNWLWYGNGKMRT